ncbi:MAG: protein kinase [Acidobacteria bacterium]|nr:protein kinase [Acidobacteriota bacterium]
MSDGLSEKLIADKYRVGELIREGEAGDLYHGRHEIMDRPVTVKILPQALGIDARWQKRFIDEARTASTVSHANVLQLNDFGTDQKGTSYAVFENTDGKTLADLESGPALDEKRAIEIAKAIADGVAAAHEKGVIHGHLSPTNIFLNDDVVKVYGFGSDPANVSKDADVRYLAPEQLGKFSTADVRSDVYSLGVTLYEMVSGMLPYDANSAADIKAKQENEPPPPLTAFRKDLNPEIEPIILSAMAVDPERRYQSMKEFAEDLELLGSRMGVPKAETAAAGGLKPPTWRTVGIVAAGVILLAGVLIYATRTKQTDVIAQLKADEGSMPVQPIGAATGAQEEALMKLPADMTPEEIAAAQNAATPTGVGAAPGYSSGPLAGSTAGSGGDNYNPWANGGQPPPGAPAYVPPAGARVSGDPNPSSPFTGEGGTMIIRKNVLTGECSDFNTGTPVPCPASNDPNARPVKPPRGAGNSNTANPSATPKPQGSTSSNKPTSNTATKPPKSSGKPGGDEPQ